MHGRKSTAHAAKMPRYASRLMLLLLLRHSAFKPVQQPGLLHQFVEQPPSLHQRGRTVTLSHAAMVQDDNAVGIEDGVDPMGDGNDGAVLEDVASQGRLEQRIRLDIDRSLDGNAVSPSVMHTDTRASDVSRFFRLVAYSSFVKHQDVGGRQQGSGK